MKITEILQESVSHWYHGSFKPRKNLHVGTGGEDVYAKGVNLTTSLQRAKTYFTEVKGVGPKEGYLHYVNADTGNEYKFSDSFSVDDAKLIKEKVYPKSIIEGDELRIGSERIRIGGEKAQAFAQLKKLFGKDKMHLVLQELGYDSIIIPESSKSLQAIVFDPKRVNVEKIEHIENNYDK